MTREDAVELLELFRRNELTELPPVSPLDLAKAYVKIVSHFPDERRATAALRPASVAIPLEAQKGPRGC